jgi:imidazole glycerol phosphate synthase glutamine amidotransferase subunit
MIKIVDYGLGNVQAFLNIYKRQNIAASIAKTAADLHGSSRIILPGVGAFDHAMELLQQSGMRETLDQLVLSQGVPVLGVCVGMQILAACSEEGQMSGLGWIPGSVRQLKGNDKHQSLRLPHMGWNDLEPLRSSRLFAGLEKDIILNVIVRIPHLRRPITACGLSVRYTRGTSSACSFILRKVISMAPCCSKTLRRYREVCCDQESFPVCLSETKAW